MCLKRHFKMLGAIFKGSVKTFINIIYNESSVSSFCSKLTKTLERSCSSSGDVSCIVFILCQVKQAYFEYLSKRNRFLVSTCHFRQLICKYERCHGNRTRILIKSLFDFV